MYIQQKLYALPDMLSSTSHDHRSEWFSRSAVV